MNDRSTFAEIDLDAISFNLKQIRKQVSPAKIMAVVKSNAYGHGLKEITEVALANEVRYFGVARVEEGIELKQFSKDVPVLVFGGFFEDQIEDFLRCDLELTLFDEQRALALSQKACQLGVTAKVHVKIDTGMGRIGVPWQKAAHFVCQLKKLASLEIVGLYTHFASSEQKDKSYADTQLARFQQVIANLEQRKVMLPLIHTANSGAILNLPASYFDLVRPGVSMYGYYPADQPLGSIPLKPALTLKSRVISVRDVDEGTYISYNRTYRTKNKTNIATVAVGYGDGYNRRLSNRGEVLIHGRRFPVVGLVCMDQIMVDLRGDRTVAVGDDVVLIGRQGDDEITIYEICEKLDTIPYEVTCWISRRVPRVYKNKHIYD